MKTVSDKRFRGYFIAVLLAAGIATTIATGGGGGSGGPVNPPPPPTGPTAPITVDNGDDIASFVILALGVSFDIGDITGGQVTPQAAAAAPALLNRIDIHDLAGKPLNRQSYAPENCAVSGTIDITAVLANPNTFTVGDEINVIYDNCDDNDGFIISGEVNLTVSAVDGDIGTNVFLLGFDVVMTGVTITDGTDTFTAGGDFNFTMDHLAYPVISHTLAGTQLQFGALGITVTMTNFDHYLEADTGAFPITHLAEGLGRLSSTAIGGSVDYETVVQLQGIGDADPYTGELLITGANSGTVRIVVVDSAHVTLEIDTNGDGVVDAYVDTSWAALNGQTSTINSSTAVGIAREVYKGVTGFGSIAITPSGQFIPTAPFGQIKAQAVSGDFGPLVLNCFTNGTATVSGFIDTAGTFSANDLLSASYTGCRHGDEVLDGLMDVTVNSYVEKPGDAFQLAATIVDNALIRDAGGSAYTGTGTISGSYDRSYTTTGVTYMDASATTFTIGSDAVDRQLSAPSVSAQVNGGQPPVTVTRDSSGSITSPALTGSFAYQSIIPDTFVFDTDPNTGPYEGEMLVTASDGSTLRIVAIDDTNVRLEIDLDGDLIIDTTIDTAWAAFQ